MTNEEMRKKIIQKISIGEYSVSTFDHKGRNVYEYIISDWNTKVLIACSVDKPIPAQVGGDPIYTTTVESMLDLQQGRENLAAVLDKELKA